MESPSLGVKSPYLYVFSVFLLILLPSSSAHATSGIANSVTNFCAPTPPNPSVSGCSNSACHSSNNPSTTDLTAAGMQSLNNPGFFCPGNTPTPAPTTTPTPTPTPGMSGGSGGGGSGMSGSRGSRSGMGFSRGGSRSQPGERWCHRQSPCRCYRTRQHRRPDPP